MRSPRKRPGEEIHSETKKVDMLPSDDYDAYTDGSLMDGRSGAGAYILRDRAHFC
jgi:hypothetical protein